MKALITVLFVLCLLGCTSGQEDPQLIGENDRLIGSVSSVGGSLSLHVVTIDGERYIVGIGSYKAAICRAGE